MFAICSNVIVVFISAMGEWSCSPSLIPLIKFRKW
jgi:hypothetical protein